MGKQLCLQGKTEGGLLNSISRLNRSSLQLFQAKSNEVRTLGQMHCHNKWFCASTGCNCKDQIILGLILKCALFQEGAVFAATSTYLTHGVAIDVLFEAKQDGQHEVEVRNCLAHDFSFKIALANDISNVTWP